MSNLANWFVRLAVLWFVAGVTLGLGMGMSKDFTLGPVHAHINLLGWVSMALFAAFYKAWPQAAQARLARAHFWIYVPAHFVMMLSLAALYRGVAGIEPVLAISSTGVGVAVACFAIVAWQHTSTRTATSAAAVPGQPA